MKTYLAELSLIQILGFVLILSMPIENVHSAEDTPIGQVDQFRTIKQEILNNCYDCFGGTESNLRSAVLQLEGLVDSGFNQQEAKKLLADSLHQIGIVYAVRDSQEQENLLRRHRQLYDELVAEYPDDIDILIAYATVFNDKDVAENARLRLRELLAEANYTSSTILTGSADTAERELALERLEEAFRLATRGAKIIYGQRLSQELRNRDLLERAEIIDQEVQVLLGSGR